MRKQISREETLFQIYISSLNSILSASHTANTSPIFTTLLLCLLVLYLYALCSLKLAPLLLLSLKGSLSSIHSFMQIAGNQHTHQDETRCWTCDDASVKSFRSAFIVLLMSPVSQPQCCQTPMQSLSADWLEMGSRWKGCFGSPLLELLFLLQLKLLHIVFDRHQNFCLNAIKIWSTLLCSSARRSVWAACLPSDELVPPCPRAPATQLWFIHFYCEDTHTHTQNTNTFDRE